MNGMLIHLQRTEMLPNIILIYLLYIISYILLNFYSTEIIYLLTRKTHFEINNFFVHNRI